MIKKQTRRRLRSEEKLTEPVSVTFTPAERQLLSEIATNEGRSVSNLIRVVVLQKITNRHSVEA